MSAETPKYYNVHVYNIYWQDDPAEMEDDDTFKEADIEITADELDDVEEIIHDYCNDHSQDNAVDGFDYEIIIKGHGN